MKGLTKVTLQVLNAPSAISSMGTTDGDRRWWTRIAKPSSKSSKGEELDRFFVEIHNAVNLKKSWAVTKRQRLCGR